MCSKENIKETERLQSTFFKGANTVQLKLFDNDKPNGKADANKRGQGSSPVAFDS